MISIQSFVFNPFQENTYVLWDETGEAVIIDPGMYESEEREELNDFILEQKLKVVLLLNTHCHVDHVLGNSYVKNTFKVPLQIHRIDLATLKSVSVYASNYGFHGYDAAEPDSFLEDGDKVAFGNSKLEVLFVPGHAPGHIAFYSKEDKMLIGGDVLFYKSIGRFDLPGGDHDTLIKSIHNKFFTLPDSTVVFPGHGPKTNIGDEKKYNPFCAIR